MEIQIFNDFQYSYSRKNNFQGFVAFIQFETLDTHQQIIEAGNHLVDASGNKDLILVPFSHISNDVKSYDEARYMFDELEDYCKKNKKSASVFMIPFGTKKELHLSSNGDAEVKFRRFEAKDKSRIKRLYNKNAELYENHMRSTGHYSAQKKLAEKFADYFQEPIIDLGAGTGFLADLLLKKNIVESIHVNDFSKSMLNFASFKLPSEKTVFSYFDASKIQLPLKFKTIICCNLFFYLQDRRKVIQNWNEHLEIGGQIIVFEEFPFLFPSEDKADEFSSSLKKLHKYLKPREIIKLFESNSLKLVDEQQAAIDNHHNLKGYIFKKV